MIGKWTKPSQTRYDRLAVEYVETALGPNWSDVLALYAWSLTLTEEQVSAVHDAFYADGSAGDSHRVAYQEIFEHEFDKKWLSKAMNDIRTRGGSPLKPAVYAMSNVAAGVACRGLIPKELFERLTEPVQVACGDGWFDEVFELFDGGKA